MKANNPNEAIAEAAKEWGKNHPSAKEFRLQEAQRRIEEEKERNEHHTVMDAFTHSFYTVTFKETIEEPYWPYNNVDIYNCTKNYPSDEILELLIKRQNHEEIMAMIKAYQQEPPYYTGSKYIEGATTPLQMPTVLQKLIAERGNFEEMSLFCSKQGFGAEGQDILLKRGNHAELVWYLEKHGFLPEQQRKLIARNNYEEIRQHILHHYLADELIDEMLNKLKLGSTEHFYKFIAIRELPEQKQTAFLELAKEPEFMAYIERYGFWEQILPDLVKLRSDTELTAYIKKHRYLGSGIDNLAKCGNTELSLLYVTESCDNYLYRHIRAFSSVPQLDYEVLIKLYKMINRPDYKSLSDAQINELEVLQDGMHSEIMALLKEQDTEFSLFAEATLFFRNFPDEYELYLNNIGRRKSTATA